MFDCKICNTSYNSNKHLIQHFNTKKHINNEKQTRTCDICNKEYKTIYVLKRHMNTLHSNNKLNTNITEINNNNQNMNNIIKDYEEKLEKIRYEDKIEHEKELIRIKQEYEIKILKHDIEIKNKLIEELEKDKLDLKQDKLDLKQDNKENKLIINKTIQYLMDKYPDAKPMHPIPDDICFRLGENESKIGRILIKCYKKGLFYKVLGDAFIKEYKTDPEKQSLWVTDLSRFNYVLNIEENENNKWIVDKRGVKLEEQYIKIFLNKINKIIEIKNNELCEEIIGKENYIQEEMLKDIGICKIIIADIYNDVASDKLIKQISPDFTLSK